MRKILIICTAIILHALCTSIYAEENVSVKNNERQSKNSMYVLGYGGLLTVGYQRLISNWVGINISAASTILLHEDLRDGFGFPVHLSFFPAGKERRLFIDLGLSYITKGKSNPIFDFYDGVNIPIIVGAGYNYHPLKGGSFYKIGIGLFIYEPVSKPDSFTASIMWAVAWGKSF
jgi:hypothetical protein